MSAISNTQANIQTGSRAMISPSIDMLMIGGASIIFLIFTWYAVDRNASIQSVSMFAYYLSVIVNFPHFLLSYQLLYYDNRKRIFREKKMFWAAVISPTILIAMFAFAIAVGSQIYLGYLVQLMFILVGWHYVKQIYGAVIVTSAINDVYYNNNEKFDLRYNMYSLWIFAWVLSQYGGQQVMYGIPYKIFALPEWLRFAVSVNLGISVLALIILAVRKYIKEGKVAPPVAIVAFLSIYAWFLPVISHPVFFYMIPFFHSLQYLLFGMALRRNKVRIQNKNLDGVEYRKKYAVDYIGYMLLSVLFGTAFFYLIPVALDHYWHVHNGMLGPEVFLFAFTIFLNIHHYFIDNAIWTQNNKEIGEYLIVASKAGI
jgi:hypothetical protein